MKPEFLDRFFENPSNMKFHENPSNGSRVVPTRRTDMTKLIVAFSNFAKAPKNDEDFGEMREDKLQAEIFCYIEELR
jgi:hypothetical protein